MSSSSRFEKHIPISQHQVNAVDVLAAETDLSKQRIKEVMQKGAVWLTEGKKTQRVRRAKRVLNSGQTLHLYYDAKVLDRLPDAPELMADLGQYSVWNKPSGLLSQGSKWGDHCTVTRWAEQNLLPQRAAFIVHRLDRAANGLIMIAHEKQAAAKLSALFQQRNIDKQYQIWVEGQFPETSESKPVTVEQQIDGRDAVSHFSVLEYDAEENKSLLNVSIETGRKHQIRRHAASLGFPVVGDRLYGDEYSSLDLQLTAYYLAFICPFSQQRRVFNLLETS